MRVCKKCGKERPLSEFKRTKQPSGQIVVRHTCVDCWRAYVRQKSHVSYLRLRNETPEKYQQKLKGACERYRQKYQLLYKSSKLEYNKTRRPKHLIAAHAKVGRAVASGKLTRPGQCIQCDTVTYVEAHHDDYSKPLEVRWLCRPCHSAVHRTYKSESTPK